MSFTISGFNTLVLNADYRPLSYHPLSICSWQEAIKAIFLGRVNVISEYDKAVHSPSTEIKIPSVISLKSYVKSARKVPALTRNNVFLRDHYECQYCGEFHSYAALTLDHVLPRCRGGKTVWTNVVACCHPCNVDKGNKMPGKGFREPMHKPRIPTCKELQKINRELSSQHIHESWLNYLEPVAL